MPLSANKAECCWTQWVHQAYFDDYFHSKTEIFSDLQAWTDGIVDKDKALLEGKLKVTAQKIPTGMQRRN